MDPRGPITVRVSGLALALVVALSCTGAQQPPATTSAPPTQTAAAASPSQTPTVTCPPFRQIQLGAVSGRVNYPANVQNTPPFAVILIRVDNPAIFRVIHTEPAIQALAPRPFHITAVEPGTYVAVGYLSPDHIAAYTPAVRCGLGASCTDHSLIEIAVRGGEIVTGVDVMDWSVPRGNLPARPAASAELAQGQEVRVCNPFADSVNVRASAGLFPVRRVLDNGAAVVVRAGPLPADGYDWYEVHVAGDPLASGWVVGYALRK